jgi:opacity protein-like surface antigen
MSTAVCVTQHLGGRGLLLQRLDEFSRALLLGFEQPHVLENVTPLRLPGVTPLSLALRGDNFALRTGWDGSARARIGFLLTPSTLVYATGGAAWQALRRDLDLRRVSR